MYITYERQQHNEEGGREGGCAFFLSFLDADVRFQH